MMRRLDVIEYLKNTLISAEKESTDGDQNKNIPSAKHAIKSGYLEGSIKNLIIKLGGDLDDRK